MHAHISAKLLLIRLIHVAPGSQICVLLLSLILLHHLLLHRHHHRVLLLRLELLAHWVRHKFGRGRLVLGSHRLVAGSTEIEQVVGCDLTDSLGGRLVGYTAQQVVKVEIFRLDGLRRSDRRRLLLKCKVKARWVLSRLLVVRRIIKIEFVRLSTLPIISRQSRENSIESTLELIIFLFGSSTAFDCLLFITSESIIPKLLFIRDFGKFAALLPGGGLICDIHLIAESLNSEGVMLIRSIPIEGLVVLNVAPHLLESFTFHLDVKHIIADCNNHSFGLADRERVSEVAERFFDLIEFRAIAKELLLARELA